MPRAGARAASSRMRASRWRRSSAPSRPRSCSPAAARKPTMPCWPPAGTRSCVSGIEHDSVLAPARRLRGRSSSSMPVGQRRRRASGCARAALLDAAAEAARSCRCSWPTTRPASLQPVAEAAALAREHGRRRAQRCRAGGRPRAHRFARARRRLPDALGPQARRAQGRRRARHSRRRQPAGASSPAAARSGGAARAPRTSRPSPASARRPRRRASDLAQMRPGARACATGWRRQVREITPEAVVVGAERRAPPQHDVHRACRAASAETLVIALDLEGIAVSAGAACSSGKVGASHVLAAMGLGARRRPRRHPHQPRPGSRRSAMSPPSSRPGASIAAGRRERAVA